MVKVLSLQSDHSAILRSFQDFPTFNNSKGNWSLFHEILKEVDFSFVSFNSNINSIESNLKSILWQSAKLAIPMTRLHFYNGSKDPQTGGMMSVGLKFWQKERLVKCFKSTHLSQQQSLISNHVLMWNYFVGELNRVHGWISAQVSVLEIQFH